MNCPQCKTELRILRAYDEERQEKGERAVYSIAELVCPDENCPLGRRGDVVAKAARRVESAK